MGKKEFKVGDIIHPLGTDITLEVVEQDGCKGCYYYGGLYVCHKGYKQGNCYSGDREDKKNVVFKKIKNGQSKGSSLTEKTAAKLSSIFNKMINDMEIKEVKIEIPEGMEIDKEESDLLKGKIAFKKKEQEVKTWDDLVKYNKVIPKGSYIVSSNDCRMYDVVNGAHFDDGKDRNFFIDEKHAKSALAMAMISQLMPYYGGKISDEEWDEHKVVKYEIVRHFDETYRLATFDNDYYFLAFHTEEQQKDFLKYNEQLVKDYLMID